MELKPSQAVALWRMLTAESEELREPTWSKIRPKLTPAQRKELLQHGLVVSARRGRANHLVLTRSAWAWAQESDSVDLGKSAEGTAALQALLRRLLPFLKDRGIQLLDILSTAPEESSGPDPQGPQTSPEVVASREPPRALFAASVEDEVLDCLRNLAKATPAGGVQLVALRVALSHLEREVLDKALLSLRKRGLVILYPNDDRASLTPADHDAALLEGETPRHLVYLENR